MGFAKLNREFASELTWPGPNPISAATCIGYGGMACIPRQGDDHRQQRIFPNASPDLEQAGFEQVGHEPDGPEPDELEPAGYEPDGHEPDGHVR